MPYRTDIKGWMFRQELEQLSRLASLVPKNGVIVEVGSFCGLSSVCLAMSADPYVSIYCYDFFGTLLYRNSDAEVGVEVDCWKEFKENTKPYYNVIPVKGFCPVEAKYTDSRPIDLLFVDAAHKNPEDWNIIEYFLPFMNVNGIISGHDYGCDPDNNAFPDVNANVELLEKMYNTKAIVGTNNSERIWYIKLGE